jgi:hypothetical protein
LLRKEDSDAQAADKLMQDIEKEAEANAKLEAALLNEDAMGLDNDVGDEDDESLLVPKGVGGNAGVSSKCSEEDGEEEADSKATDLPTESEGEDNVLCLDKLPNAEVDKLPSAGGTSSSSGGVAVAPVVQAIVATATAEASQQLALRKKDAEAKGLANSSTHRAEWADFMRQCSNRALFPVSLAPRFKSNKVGLFNLFLQHGRDLQQVQVHIEKEIESTRENESKYVWLKPRKMLEHYSDEKACCFEGGYHGRRFR